MLQNEKEHQLLFAQPVELKDDLENVQMVLAQLDYIIEEDLQDELDTVIMDNANEREKFGLELDLMIQLLQVEDETAIEDFVEQGYHNINEVMAENQSKILEKIRSYEITLRAVNLFFENAGGTVENAYFLPVDPERYLGADNKDHFNVLAEYLRNQFYAFRLKESPLFIGHVGEVGNDADKLAKIANETVAVAVVDIPETKSVKSTLKKASTRNLNGLEPEWANLAVSGTWLVGRKAYVGLEEQGLQVPSSAAIIGKLMTHKEGDGIAGFENGTISGVSGVAYESDRRDSFKYAETGLLMIMQESGKVLLYGDSTAYKSGNDDLRKVPKMIVRNRIMKDLVDFCNLKAFARWGHKEKKDFIRTVKDYLNECIRQKWIISVGKVEAVEHGTDEVALNIELVFYDTRSRYLISIAGKKEGFKVEDAKEIG